MSNADSSSPPRLVSLVGGGELMVRAVDILRSAGIEVQAILAPRHVNEWVAVGLARRVT